MNRWLCFLGVFSAFSAQAGALDSGDFKWRCGPALVAPVLRPEDPCRSVKDPSIVFFEGKWHLFVTIRSQVRTHQIEYLSFSDWKKANGATRQVLQLTNNYFCAPQVFYFTPQKKWYLIHQISIKGRQPELQPAFSETTRVDEWNSWSPSVPLFPSDAPKMKGWIDFWVICDGGKAHLFFTSNDGKMWRSETVLTRFPYGWDAPRVVLEGDIFEASHTYRLKPSGRFLTVIEAQNGGRRYYKAYLANRLDGEWKPLAATREKAFANPLNVVFDGEKWSDSFSHGELLRSGVDEKMEVDETRLRFLFQGVADADQKGKTYGEIPWKLGILETSFEF